MLRKRGLDLLSVLELEVQPAWPADTPVDVISEIWVGDRWQVLGCVLRGAVTVHQPEDPDDAKRPIMPASNFPDSGGSGHPITMSFAPERVMLTEGETTLARLALQHADEEIPGIEWAA